MTEDIELGPYMNMAYVDDEMKVERPALTTKYLEATYKYDNLQTANILKSSVNYLTKYYMPSESCCTKYVNDRFPCIDLIRKYDLKQNLLKDCLGGLTVINSFV